MTHKGTPPGRLEGPRRRAALCLQAISAAAEMRRDTDLRAWSEAQRARDLGVPERMIADCLKVSRATLQRQLAQRFPTLTDSKPPVATAPAVTALDQPPSQPAHATVAPQSRSPRPNDRHLARRLTRSRTSNSHPLRPGSLVIDPLHSPTHSKTSLPTRPRLDSRRLTRSRTLGAHDAFAKPRDQSCYSSSPKKSRPCPTRMCSPATRRSTT